LINFSTIYSLNRSLSSVYFQMNPPDVLLQPDTHACIFLRGNPLFSDASTIESNDAINDPSIVYCDTFLPHVSLLVLLIFLHLSLSYFLYVDLLCYSIFLDFH
jgi:hypothetical protein